jgi:hypothetical protein
MPSASDYAIRSDDRNLTQRVIDKIASDDLWNKASDALPYVVPNPNDLRTIVDRDRSDTDRMLAFASVAPIPGLAMLKGGRRAIVKSRNVVDKIIKKPTNLSNYNAWKHPGGLDPYTDLDFEVSDFPSLKRMKYKDAGYKPNNESLANDYLHPEATPMNSIEYTRMLRNNKDLLNYNIKLNNKSGTEYYVNGIDLIDNNNRDMIAMSIVDEIDPSQRRRLYMQVNPGNISNDIKIPDDVDEAFINNFPGLRAVNTSQGIFSNDHVKPGSGFYKALNQTLKNLSLGRLKSGGNSKSSSATNVWTNLLEKGKASGGMTSDGRIDAIMRALVPTGLYQSTMNTNAKSDQ